ncbi:MmcQ/YjbR family DNA-binding protein [Chryseolinea lacunae]|uniref:MmcQ/YjbR family DNA-binding protein n=1 Tax=Chryseolinea lacunae TaxID=2801331 RepID=A0ABS1KUP4_9BACT|nr:MmcQ/YjbR family DNA-binding protein [Chryseolinea lacunae]MBL0743156.1 MmcQ/YjbR family DNA-binding protein [Chryseolinea lacunae]
MVTIQEVEAWALALPEAVQQPHFEKTSFRIRKKIFATLDVPGQKAVVKLSAIDQSVFSKYDDAIIYPVPGAWGKQGWTMIELKTVRKSIFKDALHTAYATVAPKTLAEQVDKKRL